MTNPYAELVPQQMYRVAYNADRELLRGKPAVFLGYKEVAGTYRAEVKLVGAYDDECWYVQPHLIISLDEPKGGK